MTVPVRFAAIFLLTMYVFAFADSPRIGGLVFDAASGNIAEWRDERSGIALVEPSDAPWWSLQFQDGAMPEVSIASARAFHWRLLENQSLELGWSDFDTAPALSVVVNVSSADDGALRWSIAFDGLQQAIPAKVTFPRIARIPQREGESLAVPVWMGEQTTRFRAMLNDGDGRRFQWEYPGILSMQCLAFSNTEGPGLYMALDDTKALRKHAGFFGDGKGNVGVEFAHVVEGYDASTGRFALPYHVITAANSGGWFAAAQRYRSWALQQPWARDSRLRNGLVPDWVPETGLWVWNRGRSENVLPPAAALHEATGLPVNVFWHWWHGCSYDSGFPEYLPPREGEVPFRDALAKAHESNIHAMVYMNQRLWSMPTKSWTDRDAQRFAVKKPDGTIQPEVYNTFTKAPNASMCMGTSFWRDTYAGIAEGAYELGVDAIYMDQACSSLACYDPTHGHPLGGGTFWMDGFRQLSNDIRSRAQAHGPIALAGEGCGEAWLPYLDVMLSLQVSMERYANPGDWEPIPFFHAVYHGYAIFYGNYASLTMPPYDELWPAEFAPAKPLALLDEKFARQFRMEHARSFVWGQQPTVANFRPSHLEDRAEEMAFVIDLARTRQYGAKYLLHGTMLPPPSFTAPEDTLDMSRLSIYAGQQGALREYQQRYPLVWAAAWKAEDGDIAIALANIDDRPHEVAFELPDEFLQRPDATVVQTDANGHATLPAPNKEDATVMLTLPARYTGLVEWVHHEPK